MSRTEAANASISAQVLAHIAAGTPADWGRGDLP